MEMGNVMVICPIIGNYIDIGQCTLITYVVDGCIKEEVLSKEILEKESWKEICINCKYYNN